MTTELCDLLFTALPPGLIRIPVVSGQTRHGVANIRTNGE